ncbi:MAG: hypothetical protein E7645_08870 [Ruminococcaceae bacterium]|nr:hypothetical protein [Oscillospiraceae bacterium]
MIVTLYSIIFALSLLLPVGYYLLVRKKQDEHWLFILYLSVCVVNLGYLLLSLSKTVEFALFANKLAYFGQVFVPLCMFMIISRLSGFNYKKWVKYALVGVAMLMFALVLTTGHFDWYYKSVELTYADGAAKLIKEYGVLHPVNLIYVLAYFVAMLVVICVSLKKNKSKSYKLVGMMFAVVIGNIGGWIVEKLVKWNFEFLSASYLMSVFVFFFVYWMMQDYIHVNDILKPVAYEEKVAVIFMDSRERAEKIKQIIAGLPEGTMLTARQMDILEGILAGKSRKEMAADLHLSENTVKMHTTSLFKILKVTSREEIIALIKV